MRSRRACSSRPDSLTESEAHQTGRDDHERLRDLFQLEENTERDDGDEDRRNVEDCTPSEHDRSTADCARCRSRDAVDERLDRSVVGDAMEVWRRNDDKQVAGQEHAYRRRTRARESCDEETDEC